MANRPTFTERATMTLEALMDEYGIASVSEDGAKMFIGEYALLSLKWAIEFFVISILFIFLGILFWKWEPEWFEFKTALKIVLELGLFCTWDYVWSMSYDKHAVDATKAFIALANRQSHHFTKIPEEDNKNGNEGNADKGQ